MYQAGEGLENCKVSDLKPPNLKPRSHGLKEVNIWKRYIDIPAPSKGCQINPKGWLIDTP